MHRPNEIKYHGTNFDVKISRTSRVFLYLASTYGKLNKILSFKGINSQSIITPQINAYPVWMHCVAMLPVERMHTIQESPNLQDQEFGPQVMQLHPVATGDNGLDHLRYLPLPEALRNDNQ